MEQIILLKRTDVLNKEPNAESLDYGELAINYASGSEGIFLKNNESEIIKIGKVDLSSYSTTDEIINMIDSAITTTLNTPL